MSPRAVDGWSSSVWGCCCKPQATAAVRMAVSRSVGSGWMRQAGSIALSYWDQACLSCSGNIFRGDGRPWSASSGGLRGRLRMVRRMCRGLWPVGPNGRGSYRAFARMMVVGSP